jgi:DNA-binding CsgD family transcriptional regulator
VPIARERDVGRTLETVATVGEIAQRPRANGGTVKTHLPHINSEPDAHNPVRAALIERRARRGGPKLHPVEPVIEWLG